MTEGDKAPVVVGALSLDLLFSATRHVYIQFGGVAANLACVLGNLGMEPVFVSPAHSSGLGPHCIEEYFLLNGVTWHALPLQAEIATFLAWLDCSGEVIQEEFFDNGVFSLYTPASLGFLGKLYGKCPIITCTDLPMDAIDSMCREAEERGVTFWLIATNPDEAYKVKQLTCRPFFVSMNKTEFERLGPIRRPEELVAEGGALLVTMGSDGARVYTHGSNGCLHLEVSKRSTLSAVGAGDVFSGSLVASYLRSGKWDEAIHAAGRITDHYIGRSKPDKFPLNICGV